MCKIMKDVFVILRKSDKVNLKSETNKSSQTKETQSPDNGPLK